MLLVAPFSTKAHADVPCPYPFSEILYEADTLPQDDPVAPWIATEHGTVIQTAEEGVLVVQTVTEGSYVTYGRSDEELGGASAYTMEARIWYTDLLIPATQSTGTLSARDGEREVTLYFQDGLNKRLQLAVGSGPFPEISLDWEQPHVYLVEVVRYENAVVYVDGIEVFSVPYDELPEVASEDVGVLLAGFSAAESTMHCDYVRYRLCKFSSAEPELTYKGEAVDQSEVAPPLPGSQDKIAVKNLKDGPDPFRPPQERNKLQMDVDVYVLPGLASGQFRFNASVLCEIESAKTEEPVRTVYAEVPLSQVGTHPVTVEWDGKDSLGEDLPAGLYYHRVEVELVRIKIKGNKVNVMDSVRSPWRTAILDRDNYHKDDQKEALLAVSIEDPEGAPNLSIEIVRSPAGHVTMVYGEDFRIPFKNVGCDSGGHGQMGLCFLDAFKELFGLSDPAQELWFVKVTPQFEGDDLVVLNQRFNGYDVAGGRITFMVSSSLQVTQVHSTLALPISGPSQGQMQAAFAAFDPQAGLDTIRQALQMPDLDIASERELVWPIQDGDAYTAVPAIAMEAVADTCSATQEHVMGILDAETGQLISHVDLKATQPHATYLKTVTLFPGISESSSHPTCSLDSDCDTVQGETCSDHFLPRRCVKLCSNDSMCRSGNQCLLPGEATDLLGYCNGSYEIQVYSRTQSDSQWTDWWLNEALADHLSFSNAASTVPHLQDHHVNIGLLNSWDEKRSPYKVRFFSVCECDFDDPPGNRCREYAYCPSGETHFSSSYDSVKIVAGWRGDWAAFDDPNEPEDVRIQRRGTIAWRERVLAHEFGHLVTWSPYWADPGETNPPRECLSEGLADLLGSLFVAYQHPQGYAMSSCGALGNLFSTDAFGLSGTCLGSPFVPYAHRSRLDWLNCDHETAYYGNICSTSTDCGPYEACTTDPSEIKRCTNAPDAHRMMAMFRRLGRIMAYGPASLIEDGRDETLGIPDTPLGVQDTGRIVRRASTQLNSSTGLFDWMELMKSSALSYDTKLKPTFQPTIRALGASGFFSWRSLLTSYKADKPTRISFRAGLTHKTLLFWIDPVSADVRYELRYGSFSCTAAISADTDSRPAAVEYGNYIYVFYRQRPHYLIRAARISRSATNCRHEVLGTGNISEQLVADGTIAAAVFDGKLYLVFGDGYDSPEIHNRLSIAWCGGLADCRKAQSYHDFGGGAIKKAIGNDIRIVAGPSAVEAGSVNGLPSDLSRLFIATSDRKSGGRIMVIRMDQNDEVDQIYRMPDHYPSCRTHTDMGITVLNSAFPYPQGCDPLNPSKTCPRNYLYLIWRDLFSEDMYVSILQNADPSGTWFTKAVKTMYRSPSGPSWLVRQDQSEHVKAVYTDDWSLTAMQLDMHGRY